MIHDVIVILFAAAGAGGYLALAAVCARYAYGGIRAQGVDRYAARGYSVEAATAGWDRNDRSLAAVAAVALGLMWWLTLLFIALGVLWDGIVRYLDSTPVRSQAEVKQREAEMARRTAALEAENERLKAGEARRRIQVAHDALTAQRMHERGVRQ